jgi:hypothetical protein
MTAEEFITQLEKLQKETPRWAIMHENCINSDYTNYTGDLKNCYLAFGDAYEEDCYYSRWCFYNNNCTDVDYVEHSELCYECLDCMRCYNTNFCQDCDDLIDCQFCYNCIGCQNCFGCVNLRHKEYYFYNEPLTKEEYQARIKNLAKTPADIDAELQKIKRFQTKFPRLFLHERQTQDSTGDYIFRSKNCHSCFDIWDCEDSLYLFTANDLKDCLDTNFIAGKGSELNYEFLSGWFTSNANFSFNCWHSYNVEYCEMCFNSHDLFGCIGQNHKEYCILNKQYTKDEYEKQVAEIKADMKKKGLYGRYFLPSTYPYEDSFAHYLDSISCS